MNKVQREDILDYVTYEEQRSAIRASAMAAKGARRIHLGENLTFLFENTETVRYQILEMIRVERMVREADIKHEIDTYNELIGKSGELFATLLIEIDDVEKRAKMLAEWVGAPERIYLQFADGSRAFAIPDIRQNEDAKISSVQFLKFACGAAIPVAIGVDHPRLKIELLLTPQQSETLAEDLR
jgi:hypothetical protein